MLDFVDILGYKLEYTNCDNKGGGGVGADIKEQLTYTECGQIINLNKSVKHYRVEVSVLNKNSLYLVGICYQSSSIEHGKREWLDHFGVTKITGDFNVGLIDGDNITVNKYIDIFDAYGLTQHISYPSRHGKSLIDHISTNILKNLFVKMLYLQNSKPPYAPFVVLNIKKQKFQSRHKFVRDEKSFNLENYINHFSQLPLSTVYSLTTQMIKLKL